MSFWRRLFGFASVKAEAAMDRLEQPAETLESAFRKQLAALDDARRGVADVLTAEKRLEIEAQALLNSVERYRAAAHAAVDAGDDEAARRALGREEFALAQRERLLAQAAEIRAHRVSLESTVEKLRMRIDLFRTEKLALGARLTSARATVRASEMLGGLSTDSAEIARSVERARDRVVQAQARAEALSQLASADDPVQPVDPARIDARLDALKGLPPPRE